MPCSFPKAIQLLRDQGGTARRPGWSRGKYLYLGIVGWNGKQEALLIHRYKDGRSPQSGSVAICFAAFGDDVRALDWEHWPPEKIPDPGPENPAATAPEQQEEAAHG